MAIYNYVKTEIAFEPIYGSLREPHRTILERAGTDADQAFLLVDLLQAAGLSANYLYGTVTLPLDLAASWVRVEEDASVFTTCSRVFRALANGGVPVSTSQPCANNVTPKFVVQHVWVAADIGGVIHELDPSVKRNQRTQGIDLPTALGYDRAAFLADAEAGATITPEKVEDINAPNIADDLEGYAANLVAHIEANYPHAYVRDVVGGWDLAETPADILPEVLPYPRTIANTFSSFDDPAAPELRHKVTVNVLEWGFPVITYQSTLAALTGHRLTYQFAFSGYYYSEGTLRFEGSPIGSYLSSFTDQIVEFCVDAPFAAYGGSYGDECTERTVFASNAPHNLYAFVTEVGRAPKALLDERRAILAANQQAFPSDSEAVLGETLNVLALAWFNENGASERLQEALAGVNGYRFHAMAVMAQERGGGLTSFGIDGRLNFVHVYSPTADAEDEGTFFSAAVAQGSGIEHGFIEQLQGREGISTVRVLELANAQSIPIFLGSPANWSSVRPQLCYDAQTMANLDAAIAGGWSLVVPQCNVTLNLWQGTGWIQFAPGGEAYIIRGGLSGGSSTTSGSTDPGDALDPLRRLLDWLLGPDAWAAEGELDPVDPQTGALTVAVTDVSVAGSRPLSIEDFGRFYNSGTAGISGPFGFGWRNTYRRLLNVHSDYSRGLEGPAAVEAARLISQVFVLQDLIRNTSLTAHERREIQAIAVKWGMDALTDNAIVLSGPDGANGTFVELPGDRFSRSARLPYDLLENPDGSITLDGRAGESQHFDEVVNADGTSFWRLASWADGNGNTLTLTYDAPGSGGKLTQVTDAVGRALTFTYTGDLVTQVTDPASRVHTYGYDGAGNLVTHTDPRGFATTYGYDAAHRLTSITDPLGQTYLDNVYDSDGRVTQQTDGRLNSSFLYYGDHLTRIQNSLADNRTVAWTDDGRRQRVIDEAGAITTSHYDASGNLVRLEEPEGATSTFVYDRLDNLLQSADPLANTTVFEYDADSRPALTRDPLGHETRFTYDAEGNLTSTTNALGQATTFGYDGAGRLTDVFEPLTGAHTQTAYDAFGNVASTTNAELETTTFASDIVGQLLSVTDPLGNVRSFEYDPAGNLTRSTDPLGHQTVFEYNGNNLATNVTDPKARVTQNAYDAMNNLVLVTRPDATTIGFAYDPNNWLVTVTDPRGSPWSVEREARGLVSAEIDPLGNRHEFVYDGLRRLVRRTDAEGRVTDYTYDAASRLTDTSYDDGTAAHNTYDADGLLLTSSFGDWNADYTYDVLHRLTAEIYPYLGRRAEHTWDQLGPEQSFGDRVKLTLKVGAATLETVAYEYDNAHRLSAMTDGGGMTQYAYDAGGRLRSTTLPNGASIEQTPDEASRILSVANEDGAATPFATFDYFYDDADNVTGVTHTTPQASLTTDYGYDDLDRLLEEQTSAGPVVYTYDAAGNRLTRADAAGTTDYTYDAANQLLSAGDTTYAYDGNGNLISKTSPAGTITFAWDHENRLVGITPAAGPGVTFTYDPLGRQVSRQEAGGAATHATYDGLKLLAEGPADLSSGFVYGGGVRRLEHRRDLAGPSAVVGYAVDRLGSITNLTDGSGQPRDAYRYDAFGAEARAAGLDENAFRFGGSFGAAREPAAPGLVRMGFRYYDAETGRFISRDPIGFLGGDTNLYAYVGNNPATFGDPSGLERGGAGDPEALPWWEKLGRGYYYGTGYGEEAAEFYARRQLETGNPLWAVPGVIASLWTPETYQATAWTLLTAKSFVGQVGGPGVEPTHIGFDLPWSTGQNIIHVGRIGSQWHIGLWFKAAFRALVHIPL